MTSHDSSYPLPKRHRPSVPITPGLSPEFGSREEREEVIFKNAVYFSVMRFGHVVGGESFTTDKFSVALYLACSNDRACLYVIDSDGSGFCMGRADYKKFADLHLKLRVGAG